MGAVLAGGASRRFGSDKALHIWCGRSLIRHVIDAIRPQVSALVVVGRDFPGEDTVADRDATEGPLGGLCAALCAARARGFDAVLTSGCDLLGIPFNLAERLTPGPAIAAGQPLLGLWPVGLADQLKAHLAAGNRSLRSWVAASEATAIDFGPITNINTLHDLPPKQAG